MTSAPGPQRRFAALPQSFRSRSETGRVKDVAKTALMTQSARLSGALLAVISSLLCKTRLLESPDYCRLNLGDEIHKVWI